ncbi:MAG TPA: DUF2058 domain-containing protein [Nevskiaceae bacterium]|nr:DUF2058 domain-containing protein [Nevskiaceae bacterium]
MGLSLRDQLLNAGLLDPKKAKQNSQQAHRQRVEQARKPAAAKADEGPSLAQLAAMAKAAQDREHNRKQQEKQQQAARRAQIKQLVEAHRLPRVECEELYNFVDGPKIRRIPADGALRARLAAGTVLIVKLDGRYELLPAAEAERVRAVDARAVIDPPKADAAPAEDDPYKDYVVPDDLRW